MRRFITIIEQAEHGFYDPSANWLHGGPATLAGGHFQRGMRDGRDMGGIFFSKDNADGWRYATGYAIARFPGKPSGVYICRLALSRNEVLDFTDPLHRERVAKVTNDTTMRALENASGGGQIPWFIDPTHQAAFERICEAAGFGGALLLERKKATQGIAMLSVCVFDPTHIKIVDFVPKAEAIQRASGR
jgi:hypothetical protein